jgi:tetratricopeptide (TPR) repeat protein
MTDTAMNAPSPATPDKTAVDATIDNQHPWLGLASFTEQTRQYFYGREEEVGELSRRVQRKLLTVLFGQSGLGKTSILNAGIVPRLRPEGFCPVYVRVDYGTAALPPSEQIKQAIFRATATQGTWTKSGSATEGESLWEFLHHRDDELVDAAGKPIIPLLIFDQFEEIFTLAQADDGGRKRAAEFIEDLADLVENRPPKSLEAKIDADDTVAERFDFGRSDYRILISLREDYLANLESVKTAMPSITQNRMRLARMNGEQALAAVTKPGGKLVTQEVAESIVRFVAGGAELRNAEVEPSLLSLICRELNNARIAQGKSEISVDLLAGSNETILAEFYERSLADQPAAVRKVIEDDLLTDSGYRENLAEERVLKAFTTANAKPDAATTLATLVNRRLLRIEERLDVRRVELTHDVLCGVVKASREERLEREALAEAEKNLEAQRARAAATKKALIRARQIAAGCAVLATVAVGAGLMAYRSELNVEKTRAISETSRAEAEKLVVFILDDFYEEMSPIGRLDVIGGLAQKAVEYYKQLPPEALTADTKRNSAMAQGRYAQVLTLQGNADQAQALIDTAKKTLGEMRAGGDASDDTSIALARVGVAEASLATNRNDQLASSKAASDALAMLTPISAQASAPKSAVVTEGMLRAQLGFALLRRGLPEQAVEQYVAARKIAAASGALDLTNLPAASGYVSASWQYGEALLKLGRADEAAPVLNETIQLADQLLAKRPGHRPALRAKGTATSQLSEIEFGNLQFAEALRRAREALRVQEEVTGLDPGNSGSQNNLRVAKALTSRRLYQLGRDDESIGVFQAALVIDKAEKVSGFSMRNLVFWHAVLAERLAQKGRMVAAEIELGKAEQYMKSFLAVSKAKGPTTAVQAEVAAYRACLDLINGKPEKVDKVEPEMAKHIALRLAFREELGKDASPGTDDVLPGLYETAYDALMIKADYANAAAYAQKELLERQRSTRASLDDQRGLNAARARLAIALAKQGKQYDAYKTIEPAIAFYQFPAVQKSDGVILKAERAGVLYAAALAKPENKKALLTQAAQLMDGLPAEIRALRWVTKQRADIAAEMRK